MSNINVSRIAMVLCIFCLFFLFSYDTNAASLPPDPNNAALLYYQAFLLCPEPNDATEELLHKFLRGIKPNEKIREYIKSCQDSIRIAELATKKKECNWGLLYSQGFSMPAPQIAQARHFSFILETDARILAADGNYHKALERCLTILKFAHHINDNTMNLYPVSFAIDNNAKICIQQFIGLMLPDIDTLTWLKKQLAIVPGAVSSPVNVFEMDFELALRTMRTNNKTLPWLKRKLLEGVVDEDSRKEILNLTDEDLIARAREPYAKYLSSVINVINSSASYSDKYSEIQKLTEKLNVEFSNDPVANEIIMACASQVLKFYNIHMKDTARFNALKASIEIYLEYAKTGQLPSELHDGLPKDPYSGRDFEYEITQDGFVLRCRIKAFDAKEKYEFEYKVKKAGR